MQTILWIAKSIVIISVMMRAVIFHTTPVLTEQSEHVSRDFYVRPFGPFYVEVVGLFSHWLDLPVT